MQQMHLYYKQYNASFVMPFFLERIVKFPIIGILLKCKISDIKLQLMFVKIPYERTRDRPIYRPGRYY